MASLVRHCVIGNPVLLTECWNHGLLHPLSIYKGSGDLGNGPQAVEVIALTTEYLFSPYVSFRCTLSGQ